METPKDNLMTVEQFNAKMLAWGNKVVAQAKSTVNAKTHSGAPRYKDSKLNVKLVDSLAVKTSKDDLGVTKWISFRFNRSGVFLAYGVGRGWVREGGFVVRGSRTHEGDAIWQHLRQNGYSNKDIRSYVVRVPEEKKRQNTRNPLDWLDKAILDNIEEVANVNGDFFGDRAAKKILDQFDKMTITKNYSGITVNVR